MKPTAISAKRETFVVLTVLFADKCEKPLKRYGTQSTQRALKTNYNRKNETKQWHRHKKKTIKFAHTVVLTSETKRK